MTTLLGAPPVVYNICVGQRSWIHSRMVAIVRGLAQCVVSGPLITCGAVSVASEHHFISRLALKSCSAWGLGFLGASLPARSSVTSLHFLSALASCLEAKLSCTCVSTCPSFISQRPRTLLLHVLLTQLFLFLGSGHCATGPSRERAHLQGMAGRLGGRISARKSQVSI